MVEIQCLSDSVTVKLHVTPGTKRNVVAGSHDHALRVSVTAAPDKGKANEAVIELVATTLGVKRGQCAILSGHASRRKVLQVASCDPGKISKLIQCLASDPSK